MTMQQRIAWIVRYEIDGNGVQRHYVDDVFLETADRLVADRGYFKSVPVQMHGMLVAGNILEDEPVPLSSLHLQRLNVGPRCAIDCPGVELGALLWTEIDEGRLMVSSGVGAGELLANWV